ncbi:MAG: septum formation initiator family protein [Chthoniobacterales bacterium]
MRTGSARPDYRKRREAAFWNAVNKLLFVLIAVGGLVLTGLIFYPQLQRIDEMEKNLAEQESERDEQSLLLRQQQREEKWLKSDPTYVELLARERLGLMKDGETVFRLDEEALAMPVFPGDRPPGTDPVETP